MACSAPDPLDERGAVVTVVCTDCDHPLTFAFENGERGFVSDDENFQIVKAVMPKISAYGQETEGWRLSRLASAWGSANSTIHLFSERYRSRWNGAIISLHDRKGMLRIVWRDGQSRMLFEGSIAGAWERLGERWCSHGLFADQPSTFERG